MSSTLQKLQRLQKRNRESVERFQGEIAEARTRGRHALFHYYLTKGVSLDSIRVKLKPTVEEEELLTQMQAHLASQTPHERTRSAQESLAEAQRNARKIILNQGLIERLRGNKIEALQAKTELLEAIEAVLA